MADVVEIEINSAKYVARNAATESTLQEILEAMNRRTKHDTADAKKRKEEEDKAIERLKDMGDAFVGIRKSINSLGITVQKTSTAIERMASRLKYSTIGYEEVLGAAGAAAGGTFEAVGGVVEGFGDALSKTKGKTAFVGFALETMGSIIGMAGKTIPAAASVAGLAIGTAQSLYDTYTQLSAAGMMAGSSFQNVMNVADGLGLSLADFTKFVTENKEGLIGLAGSVSLGAKRVSALGKVVDQDTMDKFVKMGIPLAEIPEYLLDFQMAAARGGKQLDMSTAAKSALGLAQQMKMLSDLTGKDVKQLRAEGEQRALATQVQGKLLELSERFGPDIYKTFSNASELINQRFGEQGIAALNDIMTHGRATTEQTSLFLQMNKGAASAIHQIVGGMQDGSINLQNSVDTSAGIIRSHNQQIMQDQKNLTKIGQYAPQLAGTPLGSLVEDLGSSIKATLASISMTDEDFAKLKKIPEETSNSIDPTLKAFAYLETGINELNRAMQNFAVDMVHLVAEPTTQAFQTLTGQIKLFGDTVHDLIGNKGEGARGETGVTGWLKSLEMGKKLSNVSPVDWASYGVTVGGIAATIPSFGLGTGVGMGGGALIGAGVGGALNLLGQALTSIGFSEGGVSSGPDSGYLQKLHGTEAIIPLQNGESIPVKLDGDAFSHMTEKLDLLAGLNRAMLNSLEENNRLVRQGNQLVS